MPQPINVGQTATAQSEANIAAAKESARLSAIDLFGPYGSVTYQRAADGTPTAQYTNLDPGSQAAFDAQQRITGQLSGLAENSLGYLPTAGFSLSGVNYDPSSVDTSRMFSFGSFTPQQGQPMPYESQFGGTTQQGYGFDAQANPLPYDPRSYGDVQAYSDRAGKAVYDQSMSRLNPEIEQQDRRFEQMMADRGIGVGSEAYTRARESLSRSQTDARQTALNSANSAAAQEAQRILGMEQGLRSTAFGEDQTLRNTGFNEGMSLRGTGFGELMGMRDAGRADSNQAFQQGLTTHQQNLSDFGTQTQTEQNLRNQIIQEMLLGRTQPMQEASMYLQGAPAIGAPNAVATPNYNIAAPDVAGLTMANNSQQWQNYNAQQARNASMWQAGANVAGGAARFFGGSSTPWIIGALSSRSYKHDDGEPTRLVDLVRKAPVRTWRYRPEIDPHQELHIGPYAEDFQRATGLGDGKTINLIDACGIALGCIQELDRDVRSMSDRLTALEEA